MVHGGQRYRVWLDPDIGDYVVVDHNVRGPRGPVWMSVQPRVVRRADNRADCVTMADALNAKNSVTCMGVAHRTPGGKTAR